MYVFLLDKFVLLYLLRNLWMLFFLFRKLSFIYIFYRFYFTGGWVFKCNLFGLVFDYFLRMTRLIYYWNLRELLFFFKDLLEILVFD